MTKPEESEAHEAEPLVLSPDAWYGATDPAVLLRHAVPLTSRRHLSLVLADIAEGTWPFWHQRHPDDWRPALCLNVLRAWCFGEAHFAEVDVARVATWQIQGSFSKWPRIPGISNFSAMGATCGAAIATAYAYEADTELSVCPHPDAAEKVAYWAAFSAPDDADVRAADKAWEHMTRSGTTATEAEQIAAEDAKMAAYERQKALCRMELAEGVRRLIPYSTLPATKWEVSGEFVQTGNATLRIKDWRIVEAWHPTSRRTYARRWN